MGFDGVQNFPTVGLIDGVFRAEPRGDRHGLRPRGRDDPRGPQAGPADVPVRLRRRQRARRWPRPAPTCWSPHLGLTTKGSIGAKTALTLDESAARVQAMHDAARAVRKDVLVLCHGGPIAEPEDAEPTSSHTRPASSASSARRASSASPPRVGIEAQARRFRDADAARQGSPHPHDNEEDRPRATLTRRSTKDWHASTRISIRPDIRAGGARPARIGRLLVG